MEGWNEENERGMCVLLGISGVADAKVSMEVVKTFLESVWKKQR